MTDPDRDVAAIVPPEDLVDAENCDGVCVPLATANLARDALDALRSGNLPSDAEAAALREVLRTRRPALRIVQGQVETWPEAVAELGADWEEFVAAAGPLLQAVGRIERAGVAVGTAFLVADHVVVTNRHVVEELDPDDGRLSDCLIRFAVEDSLDTAVSTAPVVEVVAEHADADVALLRLGATDDLPAPLPLAGYPVAVDASVVSVGYPFDDNRNPAFTEIFGDNLTFETVSPGRIRLSDDDGTVEHDCETLGGCSGSPLIDIATGNVVAIHYDGLFLARNKAVSAAVIKALVAEHC